MDKVEKLLRKNYKIVAKRNHIRLSHNVIFVKKLNKLDKELDCITNKLFQEIETLRYKSKISTITKITDILDSIKRLKTEIKYEKRNLDLDGNNKFTYPKRQVLVKPEINPMEEILRSIANYTIAVEQEIPY